MFEVTKEWLKQYSTKGIAWNKKQIEALGLSYPAPKGWIVQVTGNQIELWRKELFELECGRSQERLEIQRKIDKSIGYPVYYTCPDGNGSWKGKWLEPHELGKFPND